MRQFDLLLTPQRTTAHSKEIVLFLIKFLWKVITFPFRLISKIFINLGLSILVSTVVSVVLTLVVVGLGLYGLFNYTPLGYLVGDPFSSYTPDQISCMTRMAWDHIDMDELNRFSSSRNVSDLSLSSVSTILSNASACK